MADERSYSYNPWIRSGQAPRGRHYSFEPCDSESSLSFQISRSSLSKLFLHPQLLTPHQRTFQNSYSQVLFSVCWLVSFLAFLDFCRSFLRFMTISPFTWAARFAPTSGVIVFSLVWFRTTISPTLDGRGTKVEPALFAFCSFFEEQAVLALLSSRRFCEKTGSFPWDLRSFSRSLNRKKSNFTAVHGGEWGNKHLKLAVVCVCVHACARMRMCVCVSQWKKNARQTCVCVRAQACTRACTRVRAHMCVCVCVCLPVCAFVVHVHACFSNDSFIFCVCIATLTDASLHIARVPFMMHGHDFHVCSADIVHTGVLVHPCVTFDAQNYGWGFCQWWVSTCAVAMAKHSSTTVLCVVQCRLWMCTLAMCKEYDRACPAGSAGRARENTKRKKTATHRPTHAPSRQKGQ